MKAIAHRTGSAYTVVVTCTALFLASMLMMPLASTAGEIDLDDQMNAKLARIKSEQKVLQNTDEDDVTQDGEQPPNEDCGSIDIGNVATGNKVGGPREVNVIVVGDVINAFNDCK